MGQEPVLAPLGDQAFNDACQLAMSGHDREQQRSNGEY